ncbi:hypothetical protein cypCar_00039318 [Cyprinus carpio]|nr:hypothetical protein cypCar_00039318 [Cyprinus carpio]
METSDEQVNEAQPTQSVHQQKALCETPSTRRTSTRGSLRFGSLSHHSFFSRHNPHPHRVRHMQDEEVPRRKTQYSAQSGRIIPASSWGGMKRRSRTSHKRAQRWQTQTLEGVELKVLELLCQILQTDSLSMVQQWLLLASDREKELVQGLLQQAMTDSSSLTQQTSGSELLPLSSEDLPDHVFLSSSVSQRKSISHPEETLQDKPERIGEAEVLTLYPENT